MVTIEPGYVVDVLHDCHNARAGERGQVRQAENEAKGGTHAEIVFADRVDWVPLGSLQPVAPDKWRSRI